MIYTIKKGNIQDMISVLEDAIDWLREKGEPLWDKTEITTDTLSKKYPKAEIYVCYDSHENPIGSIILQYEDVIFWPGIPYGESGFIHKLAVTKEYHGKGIAGLLIAFAEENCRKKGIKVIRLDCAGGRKKLCEYYLRPLVGG